MDATGKYLEDTVIYPHAPQKRWDQSLATLAALVEKHEVALIAVGNGKPLDNGETRKPEVKVGDKVMFGKFSGTEIKVDGDEVVVMREDDILAVLG